MQEDFYLIKNINYNHKIKNDYKFFQFFIDIYFKIIYHLLNIFCFITRLNQLIKMKIIKRLIIIKLIILMQFIFCKLQIILFHNFFQNQKTWDKSKLSNNFEVKINIKLWKLFMLVFSIHFFIWILNFSWIYYYYYYSSIVVYAV